MEESGKKTAKEAGKKKSKFKVEDRYQVYNVAAGPSEPENKNVVVLQVGLRKDNEVVISGFEHLLERQKYFDVYESKNVSITGTPLHYQSKMEFFEVAQEGISAKAIERLAELLKITKKQASDFFHFSERTMNNYIKKDKILDTDSSEKILKIFSLYLYGLEVFGSRKGFINWLSKPAFGLKNKKPTSLFSSSDGIDLIQEELSRMEYGDFA